MQILPIYRPSNDLEYRQATLELGEENLAFVLGTFILGLSHLILGYLMIVCLNITAQRQVHRIKSLFLRAILRQDIGWFDKQRTRDFASRTAE